MQILESPQGSNAKPLESTAYPRRDPRVGSQYQTKILQNCTKNDGRRPPDRISHDHVYSYCSYDSQIESNEGETEICCLICHEILLRVVGSRFMLHLDSSFFHFQCSCLFTDIHVVDRFLVECCHHLASGRGSIIIMAFLYIIIGDILLRRRSVLLVVNYALICLLYLLFYRQFYGRAGSLHQHLYDGARTHSRFLRPRD